MVCWFFFFFNDTATTEIYTLSLHDALPICGGDGGGDDDDDKATSWSNIRFCAFSAIRKVA